jgi:hypothetical protein
VHAEDGSGQVVLVSYRLFGGFDVGLGAGHLYLGDGYRLLAPSRFAISARPSRRRRPRRLGRRLREVARRERGGPGRVLRLLGRWSAGDAIRASPSR